MDAFRRRFSDPCDPCVVDASVLLLSLLLLLVLLLLWRSLKRLRLRRFKSDQDEIGTIDNTICICIAYSIQRTANCQYQQSTPVDRRAASSSAFTVDCSGRSADCGTWSAVRQFPIRYYTRTCLDLSHAFLLYSLFDTYIYILNLQQFYNIQQYMYTVSQKVIQLCKT